MEGPENIVEKDYWFSADVLDPQQVAETLTAATGRKFTAAVRDHDHFLKKWRCQLVDVRTSVCQGRNRIVPRGRARKEMAYIGSAADDTKKVLGREPLLLRDWAKLHANELLEIAGS